MDFTRLDAFLDRLTSWRVPGNDCVIMKDGKVIYRHLSGYADIELGRRIKGDETYNMWSCSKPITCAAALTLVENGTVLLTDAVSKYLPEYKDVKVKHDLGDGRYELVSPKREITVRDLFTMASGYDYDTDKSVVNDVKRATDGKCPTREMVRAFAKLPLAAEPGTRWIYGISHDILAGLTEVAAGERFNDYVKRVIFDPLEMKDSTYTAPRCDILDRMARQYSFDYEKERAIPSDNSCGFVFGSDYDSGGAGLVSSVDDYIKFAYAMANGGVGANGKRILSRRTVDLMRENALNEEQMRDITFGQYCGYGYGLGVRTMVNRSVGGSVGPVGEFGWAGAAGAWVMIDPENNLAAFYCMHMLNNQEDYIVNRLRNIIYNCLDE